MTYYMTLNDDSSDIIQYDVGILGETTKKSFYPNRGFERFKNIINLHPEKIPEMNIFDDNEKKYSAEQFINIISKLKIMEL